MIGLFIGSFNPPTEAHLDICKNLKDHFKKIVLVPVNSNDKYLVDFKKRVELLNILKNKYSFLEISTIMKDYSYLNYRIIDLLKKEYGNINIIMGSDLLEKFEYYDNYEYLLSNYYFTVVPRNNTDVSKLIKDKYSKYYERINILDYHSDISSTKARELIKNKQSLENVLDKDVLCYIEEHDLY